jgi:hypothetical protein
MSPSKGAGAATASPAGTMLRRVSIVGVLIVFVSCLVGWRLSVEGRRRRTETAPDMAAIDCDLRSSGYSLPKPRYSRFPISSPLWRRIS